MPMAIRFECFRPELHPRNRDEHTINRDAIPLTRSRFSFAFRSGGGERRFLDEPRDYTEHNVRLAHCLQRSNKLH